MSITNLVVIYLLVGIVISTLALLVGVESKPLTTVGRLSGIILSILLAVGIWWGLGWLLWGLIAANVVFGLVGIGIGLAERAPREGRQREV